MNRALFDAYRASISDWRGAPSEETAAASVAAYSEWIRDFSPDTAVDLIAIFRADLSSALDAAKMAA